MQGEAFIGAAGGLLNARILPMAGLKREQVKVDNCVRCRPPNDWLVDAPWQFSAITHCRQYLQESLDAPELQVVVTLGDTALRSVLNLWGTDGVRVQDFHGTRHRDPSGRFWVVPTYHPSHLQRGAINLLDVVRYDIEVGRGLLNKGGFAPRPVSLVLDPSVERFRSWAQSVIQRALVDPAGTWLAVDIETPDKEGGRDEGELSAEDRSTQIDRVNFSVDEDEGMTVPYDGPYIEIIDSLVNSGAWLFMWNKWYDESRLRFEARHKFIDPQGQPVVILDLMWLAHHYQSDWPLGLGFWAPFASDYGAWKHLAKSGRAEDGVMYAAIDGIQTRRVGSYLIERAMKLGLWDAFYRHTHLREQYVLRPAHENGCPISEERLDKFHEKLQAAATERLNLIQASEMSGTLRPKAGYAKRPKGEVCPSCQGNTVSNNTFPMTPTGNEAFVATIPVCQTCGGWGDIPKPPKSILGKAGEKGDSAKQQYMEEGVQLVERTVQVQILTCQSCGQIVTAKHNCLRPKKKKGADVSADAGGNLQDVQPAVLVASITTAPRWFWQLPFNPDSSQQILAFIKGAGLEPGRAKKTRKETADKETLRRLAKTTGNPIYTHLLEYKAVKKVDSTYAVGAKRRIWSDGRLHPQPTFRPSTLRDSYVSPNIQNVVADKDKKGAGSLAAGFRDCIVADPGYRLLELDYSGIEGVITGWLCGDPAYIRLATLGVHAYLTAFLLHDAKKLAGVPDLAWSDQDLAAFFSDIKKKFPEMYDKAKRCVHGNNYGLTTHGMVNNFPDVFTGGLKEAQRVQDMYYALAPKLPQYHSKMRDHAYEHGFLGGSYVDDYTLLTSGGHHPWGYMHYFYGVMSFRPLNEANYRRLMWIAKNRMNLPKHPRVAIIHNRPFEKVMGEDSKRVIAFPPQSIAAGTLKEAALTLFHPDSPDTIGTLAEGKTPLVAPIHDSFLLHVPDHLHEWVVLHAAEVMRRSIPTMPLPADWGMGTHLRVNVAAKVSPVGGSWAECEDVALPEMVAETARETLYSPVEDSEWDEVEDLQVMIAPQVEREVA